MHITDTEQFKIWLTKTLENICEADPCALAKYIIALLKKNKNVEDLKSICTEQLNVFLKHHTDSFIVNMFEALQSNSYFNQEDSQIKSSLEEKDTLNINALSDEDSIINQNNDQKVEVFSDENESSEENTHAHEGSRRDERTYTPLATASTTRNRWDRTNDSQTCNNRESNRARFTKENTNERHYTKKSQSISATANHNFGLNLPGLANLPLFPSPDMIKSVLNNQLFNTLFAQNQKALSIGKSHINTSDVNEEFNSKSEDSFQTRKRRGQQAGSNVVPIPKYKSNNNHTRELILRKVPSKNMNISIVNEYFSEFGQVTNVMLSYEQDPSSILIEFATSSQARKAFESQKAIFGNRFIKTFLNNAANSSAKLQKKIYTNNTQPQFPNPSELSYVNPNFLVKNNATDLEKDTEISLETEENKRETLDKIEHETKEIMTQLKSSQLSETEKNSLKDRLKQIMKEKDSLIYSDKNKSINKMTPHQLKINKRQIRTNFHLDNRPKILSITLNKFSNTSDILIYFEKYGKIESSKITDTQLIITYTNHVFAAKAFEEAAIALGNRINEINWWKDTDIKIDNKNVIQINSSEEIKN